jgi:sugar phosphate isomerase/epimerase
MIAYGYPRLSLDSELDLAERIGASVLEILPEWRTLPDPAVLRRAAEGRGLRIHSAHGCWGGQSIRAERVDLGHPEPAAFRDSLDDLRRCLDWLAAAGGRFLVVHPGGLSTPAEQPARTDALACGLTALADHARGAGLIVCVENMPPGVYPGSRMADLRGLLTRLHLPELALALDTGHAHLSANVREETLAAGELLRTTHVHDNLGCSDTHDPPGKGSIDWPAWGAALDAIEYEGPIMLECVRRLREDPALLNQRLLEPLLGTGDAAG